VDSPARIVRAGNWWASKLPPLIGLALALAVLFELTFGRTVEVILAVILITGGSVGAYGHLLNDLFDLEADRRAGRRNRLSGVAPPIRVSLVVAFLGLTFAPALVVNYGVLVLALLVVECSLPAIYSVPPLRLKDRGVWGVLADAGGAHVVPALIVTAAAAGSRIGEHPVAVAGVVVWSLAVGLEGILWHQLRDRHDDRAAGARTLAVRRDPEQIRRALLLVLHPLKSVAVVVLVLALQPRAPILAVALAAYLVLDVVKWALGWRFVYAPGDPMLERSSLPLVSNAFTELWFPVALAVDASASDRRFLLVAAGVALVFHRGLLEQGREAGALVRDLARRLVREPAAEEPVPPEPDTEDAVDGWRLECHEDAAGTLLHGDRLRLEIFAPGAVDWHLKLTRSVPPLIAGAVYELRCEIAADEDREATLCVVRDGEPWDNLGLSERVVVGTAPRSLWHRFPATACAEAKIDLLLGGSAVGVTLAEASLERRYDPADGESA
jgi:4-hydroxybenzoate polyprenyltransferase